MSIWHYWFVELEEWCSEKRAIILHQARTDSPQQNGPSGILTLALCYVFVQYMHEPEVARPPYILYHIQQTLI
jgi:hypothetical protein